MADSGHARGVIDSAMLVDIARVAGLHVGAEAVGVILADESSTQPRMRHVASYEGLGRELLPHSSIGGPAHHALAVGAPVVVADVAEDPRFKRWHRRVGGPRWRAFLTCPMRLGAEPLGVLEVYKTSPTEWDCADIARADAMAHFVAVLVRDTMRIGEQERHIEALMGVVEELDREVHETANEVHSLDGLIALGDGQRAQALSRQLLRKRGKANDW